jgi:dihydroorotate dehydrogenase (fumarate)
MMEQAGADAMELNLYEMACDPTESGSGQELHVLNIVKAVKSQVKIPVAVKLAPFYSSLPHFAGLLREAGADGLVLFNRFYHADVDIENLEVTRGLHLSDSSELLLRLRWLAVLSTTFEGSLAATGGVHSVHDVIKAVMCGAHSVQVVSALLQRGPGHLKTLLAELTAWLEEHEYESLEQMCGSMNLSRCPNPREYERTNYVQILQTWEA